MRVTKIIREYVEKTVTAKMPYGAPMEELQAANKELNDLCDRLEKQVEDYVDELLNGIDNLPEGFTIKRTNYRIFSASSWNSPMQEAANTHQREIRDKRAAAIERILLELELAQPKQTLSV